MSKFVTERAYKIINEDNDFVMCFVVKNEQKTALNLMLEELEANKGKVERKLDIEVKPYKSKRTLEQNAALWWILGKLAEAMSGSKNKVSTEEAYCIVLEQANIEYDYMLALPEAEPMLRKSFRVIRKIDEREVNGKKLNMYQYFTGSSKFNTKQMNDLILNTLNMLDELGIRDSEIESFRSKYEK